MAPLFSAFQPPGSLAWCALSWRSCLLPPRLLPPNSLRVVPLFGSTPIALPGCLERSRRRLRTLNRGSCYGAARVKSETQRHLYRYQRNPAEFENSEGLFRMVMLSVVLAEDFNVHYDESRKQDPESARLDDGFFADAD